MNPRTLAWPLLGLLLAFAPSARAFDFGIGLEGAGTGALSNNLSGNGWASTSAGAGILVEERFNLIAVELTLWEDAQLPYTLNVDANQSGAADTGHYIPLDAGLRLGLGVSPLRPYLGVLVNDSILSAGPATAASNFFGVGGDLGLDIAVIFLRFGIELRALTNLTPVNTAEAAPSGYTLAGSAWVLQGLLSARFSF